MGLGSSLQGERGVSKYIQRFFDGKMLLRFPQTSQNKLISSAVEAKVLSSRFDDH